MKPTLVIIGLGNPGAQYARTRHNAGFLALDTLSAVYGEGDWQDRPKFLAQVQEARIITVPVLLVKPQTYMNLSGDAVRKLVQFYKLDPLEQILLLSDDIDLPLGELRLRRSGGPGTHNGLKSVVHEIGEEFPRIRIGLGAPPAGADLAAWVLSAFSQQEAATLHAALEQLPAMVRSFVLGGEGG